MNKFDEVKKLRLKANELEDEAENEVMPALLKKYKYLVGTCLKVRQTSSDDKWTEYYKITEIERINVINYGDDDTVSVVCFSFCPKKPYEGFTFTERDHTYYHILLQYGKVVPAKEFEKQLAKCIEKIR